MDCSSAVARSRLCANQPPTASVGFVCARDIVFRNTPAADAEDSRVGGARTRHSRSTTRKYSRQVRRSTAVATRHGLSHAGPYHPRTTGVAWFGEVDVAAAGNEHSAVYARTLSGIWRDGIAATRGDAAEIELLAAPVGVACCWSFEITKSFEAERRPGAGSFDRDKRDRVMERQYLFANGDATRGHLAGGRFGVGGSDQRVEGPAKKTFT